GLPRHAGSANLLSPFAGATSERPSAIDTNSRPSAAARDATVPGCLARLSANLLHATLGSSRSAIPTAELVNSRSSGAASSSAVDLAVGTTCHASSGGGFTSRRSSLPVGPVGRASTNQIRRGYLYAATRPFTNCFSSSGSADAPAFRTTAAPTSSPSDSCGMPVTTTAATAGCSCSAPSTPRGETLYPPRMIKAFLRSTAQKYPSPSTIAMSPVENQPSLIASAVASGRFQYPFITLGPLTWISPAVPVGTSLPSSSTRRTWTPSIGVPIDPARRSASGWLNV